MKIQRLLIYIITLLFVSTYANAQVKNQTNKNDLATFYYNKGIDFGKARILDSALYFSQLAVMQYNSSIYVDSIKLANAYLSLGIINKISGKYSDAIKCYNQAEKIYILQNNELLQAYVYANKANIYNTQQDYAKARDFQLRAYDIYIKDSIKNKSVISIAYNNLGNIYRRTDNYETAIDYYKKSIKLHSYTDHKVLGNLANCYKYLKNEELAESYFKKSIQAAIDKYGKENINSASRFLSYAIFLSEQNKNNALNYFQPGIQIYKSEFGDKHPSVASAFNSIGNHYLRNNNLDSALYYFQESLIALSPEFNDKKINSNPRLNNVLSKTHIVSALKNKAYALYLKANNTNDIQYYKLSLSTFDKTIELIDIIRLGYVNEESKLFLAENQHETYSNALQTCYELFKLTKDNSYIDKAFDYSESGKASVLKEAITNTQALNIGGIPDSLIIKERELEKSIWNYEELIYEEKKKKNPDKNKLEYWNEYLFENKVEFDRLTKFLESNYPKYYALKYNNKNIPLNALQNKLCHDDVIIDFSVSKDFIYTFLITDEKTTLIQQKINNQFHCNLDTLLKSLSNNNFSYHGLEEFNIFQKSSNYIYNLLIDPISNNINNKNITIIPDGKLAYLPFETLISEFKYYDKLNYKDLPYLLKTNAISYSHSANYLLNDILNNKAAVKTLAAFAPTYNNIDSLESNLMETRQEYRENLFPLKGTIEEATSIAELTNGDTYLDFNSTEKQFKKVASKYDILHLAMHTVIDDQNPMYSKLVFTQNKDTMEDGFLNTYELYNMKLNSRMAVLSSCNSGSGKLQRGEGVMSLARGFIYAGCPSLVMTLWPVEDKSGVRLMTSFYKYLIKGEKKSEALQKSKIEFLENADQLKSHPYFWSGYVIIGNDNALFKPYKKYLLGFGVFVFIALGIFLKYRKN